MQREPQITQSGLCGKTRRRTFLADCGMGFMGLALGAILQDQGIMRAADTPEVWTPPDGKPWSKASR